MRYQKTRVALLVVVLCALTLLGGTAALLSQSNPVAKFELILRIIDEEYVDPVDINALLSQAWVPQRWEDVDDDDPLAVITNQLLAQLDPNSRYYTPEAYAELTRRYRGNYHGIGIAFVILDGAITVLEVFDGGPSDSAGLRPGDRIVAVDGTALTNPTNQDAFDHLLGPAGSTVTVDVERAGAPNPVAIIVTRGTITRSAVSVQTMLTESIGYVQLSTFSGYAANDLLETLLVLRQRGMTSLILDLRGNLGGLLRQAKGVANMFTTEGKTVVSTQGRHTSRKLVANSWTPFAGLPLVVLVNGSSASASEIVAGALQDHNRALIVGKQTFGKASVQSFFSFDDRTALKLTTANYYTPAGRMIYGIGIRPDIPVEPDAVTALAEYLHGSAILFQFVVQYLADHPLDPNLTPETFSEHYTVPAAMLTALGEYLHNSVIRKKITEDGVGFSATLLEEATPDIRRLLLRQIAEIRWGREEGAKQTFAHDRQLQEALRLVPVAGHLLKQ